MVPQIASSGQTAGVGVSEETAGVSVIAPGVLVGIDGFGVSDGSVGCGGTGVFEAPDAFVGTTVDAGGAVVGAFVAGTAVGGMAVGGLGVGVGGCRNLLIIVSSAQQPPSASFQGLQMQFSLTVSVQTALQLGSPEPLHMPPNLPRLLQAQYNPPQLKALFQSQFKRLWNCPYDLHTGAEEAKGLSLGPCFTRPTAVNIPADIRRTDNIAIKDTISPRLFRG